MKVISFWLEVMSYIERKIRKAHSGIPTIQTHSLMTARRQTDLPATATPRILERDVKPQNRRYSP